MNVRTWPYGTTKAVDVLDVIPFDGCAVVVCVEPREAEGFVLLQRATHAHKGDRATITFTPGGPTGGYWQFETVI